MPISALPDHLKDVENAFPDDDQYGTNWFGRLYRKYNKVTKTWFAFSYRCTEWWAKWRKVPKLLFVLHGEGLLRIESDAGRSALWNETTGFPLDKLGTYISGGVWYLSRIQKYTRWHIAVQWPLMVSFHCYPKAEDVLRYGEPEWGTDGKLWFFYWNHYDSDLIYWMLTSIYSGKNWK